MKSRASLVLTVAVFLCGVSVHDAAKDQEPGTGATGVSPKSTQEKADTSLEHDKSKSQSTKGDETTNENPVELLEQFSAAMNPVNLISALVRSPEDKLLAALPTFDQLEKTLDGTPLASFVQKIKIIVGNSNPQMWKSIIEKSPEFAWTIIEVGGQLSTIAQNKLEKVATGILNDGKVLSNSLPDADALPGGKELSEARQQGVEKLKGIVQDNVLLPTVAKKSSAKTSSSTAPKRTGTKKDNAA